MEKLSMCRICLVENVRMYVVADKNLQEIYEKLTDSPFVTEDSRPMLACFFCYTKLKQCGQLQRKCLEAEKLFAQMLNEDCEPNPTTTNQVLEIFSGFIISPTVHISIFDECQTENDDIKEELPDTCEGQDDIIEPKEEYHSDELELEYQDIEYLDSLTDQEDVIPDHSESEDIIPLVEFKSVMEREQEIPKMKLRQKNTERATVAKKPRRAKLDDTTAFEQKKSQPSDCNFIRTEPYCASEYVTKVKEPVTSANTTVTNCNIDKSKGKLNKPNIIEVTNNLSTAIDTHCRRNSNKDNLIRKIRNNKVINSFDINSLQTLYEKKLFKCDVCSREFTTKCNLKQHILKHTGEKKINEPYKCDICYRFFTRKSNLRKHIVIHTGEESYKCDVCQRSFVYKQNFTRHIQIHTGEKPYKCDVCQRSFAQKSNLKRHTLNHSTEKKEQTNTHTGEKPFKCDICKRCFTCKTSLTRHIRIHTGEPYKCDVCQRSFAHKLSFNTHILSHTGEKPYKCYICHRFFVHKTNLGQHILTHAGEKPYKCDICHRFFSQRTNLRHHIRTHTGEKPYKCDICQRSFAVKQNLKNHTRIHTGEKPYKCDICQRSYPVKRYLTNHIRSHSGEKPYKCDVCQRSFTLKQYLNNHYRIHTGEKPYK